MKNIQNIIFYLAFLFPFVSFGLGDTSPILIGSIIGLGCYLSLIRNKLRNLFVIWIIFTFAISAFYAIDLRFNTASRVLIYGLVIPFSFSIYSNISDIKSLLSILKFIRIAYIVIACIQIIVGLDVYSAYASTVMRVSYADGRGFPVVGTEPTTFATLYLLYAIVAYHLQKTVNPKSAEKFLYFDLIAIFALTLSSSYLLYLFISGAMYTICTRKIGIKFLIITFLTLVPSLYTLFIIYPEIRLFQILLFFFTLESINLDVLNLIDQSVLDRLSQPLFSVYFFISNCLAPNDPKNVILSISSIHDSFSYLSSNENARIHMNSGIGELLIFYGAIGFIPLFLLWKIWKVMPASACTLLVIYIFPMPFGGPTFWIACSVLAALCRIEFSKEYIKPTNQPPVAKIGCIKQNSAYLVSN